MKVKEAEDKGNFISSDRTRSQESANHKAIVQKDWNNHKNDRSSDSKP
jgi:hypothetical protein